MSSNVELSPANRIFVAFDYESIHAPEAQSVLYQLETTGAGAKVGLEITAQTGWPAAIQEAQQYDFQVFADAKLHDIGNTVQKAARAMLLHTPEFLNVHASTSEAGLRGLVAARDEVQKEEGQDLDITQLLGVTVLTDVEEAESIADYRRGRKKQVLHFADKLLDCGLDGLVCSPQELDILTKHARFDRFVKMVPAIRPKWSVPDDQKNFTTPAEAIRRGATHIVVGRPITAQYDKIGDSQLDAFRAVEQEVKEAL